MIRSTVEVVSERGYEGLSATLIVARARASRKTFYEHFESCEDCFLAAYEAAIDEMAQIAASAYQRDGSWPERVRAALEALLGFLEHERAIATLVFVEAPRAGPGVQKHRARTFKALKDALDRGGSSAKKPGGGRKVPRLAAETIVGGAVAIMHARLRRTQRIRMMSLVNPLMEMIVEPYLGPEAAARELARPTPRVPTRPRPVQAQPIGQDPLKGLRIRVTYRTLKVLVAIGQVPGARNCDIADAADVVDHGQISKLLARLEKHGLICDSGDRLRTDPHEWHLTPRGEEVERAIRLDFAS